MVFLIPWYNNYQQCKNASNNFIKAIVTNDIESAENLSRGKVSLRLATAEDLPKAKVINVNAKTLYVHGNLAKTNVVCELETSSGQDVTCYDIYLFKEDTWKVYKVNEATTEKSSTIFNNNTSSVSEAENVIKKFINCVSQGTDAKSYLAGPAKTAYEQTSSGISGIVNIDESSILTIPLYSDDKTVTYSAKYNVDGKPVRVLVDLYKLEAWKIISITQL